MNQLMGFMSIFKKDFIVFKVAEESASWVQGVINRIKDAIQIINDLLAKPLSQVTAQRVVSS